MEEFQYKHNELWCEESGLNGIAEQCGTPLYVYSKRSIVDHCRHVEKAFGGIDHLSCYAVKANANDAAELVNAVREVLRGGTYITTLVDGNAAEAPLRPSGARKAPGSLSARQREVLQLVAEGHSVKEIASILHVSIKTVEFHKAGIVRKLGFHTTAELTRYAIRSGLVEI